jgi:alpha-tubulin suppressor-like RCC1 family protein
MVTTWQKNDPLNVPGSLNAIIQIAEGPNHYLALKNNGTCVVWLGNQVSFPYFGLENIPPSATEIVSIACGPDQCFAIKGDGSLVAWGNTEYLQNGLQSLTGIKAISADRFYYPSGMGLFKNGSTTVFGGTVYSWQGPYNSIYHSISFFLGLRDNGSVHFETYSEIPPPSVPLTGISQISGGAEHALALRQDGTVLAWGYNSAGQSTVPPGLSNVRYIFGGEKFSVALKKAP